VGLPLGQSARRASILVVDDEPDVADLFRQHFRREARQGIYVMHFAASGAEALDRLSEEFRPAVVAVLSDINMPGMDGLQLLAEIKQRFPDLPVMMVTAYGDEERRRLAAEYGAAEFITGPAIRLPRQKPALSCQGPIVRIHLPPAERVHCEPDAKSTGAYAYGKGEKRTEIVDGRARA
jgi:CheY-like chemotaxis protein